MAVAQTARSPEHRGAGNAEPQCVASIQRTALSIAGQEIRRLGVWADPEDLAQEGLTRLQAQTGWIVEPGAWLRTVIRNLVIDLYRRELREGLAPQQDSQGEVPERRPDGEPTMEGLFGQREFMAYVLSRLDERDRQVFLMRGIIGHPARRVAVLLSLSSPAAVDQAYLRAKRRLKAHLEQRPDLLAELRR